jgi:hypothetical protein
MPYAKIRGEKGPKDEKSEGRFGRQDTKRRKSRTKDKEGPKKKSAEEKGTGKRGGLKDEKRPG